MTEAKRSPDYLVVAVSHRSEYNARLSLAERVSAREAMKKIPPPNHDDLQLYFSRGVTASFSR
jgi:hypothetical protein